MCGKRLFDFFNFLWWRGNNKENAKKTLGNSNSTGILSSEVAVKEESCTNKNDASFSMSGKKTMNSEYMSEYSMEMIVSDDKKDFRFCVVIMRGSESAIHYKGRIRSNRRMSRRIRRFILKCRIRMRIWIHHLIWWMRDGFVVN